ncbi:MAG TPA: alpha-N-arabinofuranosidase, partial [Alphaproteobacteria bacterium]|nr:alpha-N-arabinofuranosidase [Alphaproteobacteria bacterium]
APERQIGQAVELLNQTGFGDRIKIAFDEWNLRGWHHPGFPGGGANQLAMIRERDNNDLNETYTMADAVFSASFLNACLRQAKYVQMACMAPVVNVRGPLFVHPKGIVKRTTFHVLKMYSDLLQPNVIESRVVCDSLQVDDKSVQALDAVTTCSSDRKHVAVALVNRHPRTSARWKMHLRNVMGQERAKVTILSGDSPDAYNDVAHPSRVVPHTLQLTPGATSLELPPHSISVVQYVA